MVFGWKLTNANALQQNAPGIDLVDDTNCILVQVTGTSSKSKIEHSLEEISEKYACYHFYFAPIVNDAKAQRKHKYAPPYNVVFNPQTDILDIHFIMDRIKEITDVRKIEAIATFVRNNIRHEIPNPILLTSGLDHIICQLADDDLEESNFDITAFEIEAKIRLNSLSLYGVCRHIDGTCVHGM